MKRINGTNGHWEHKSIATVARKFYPVVRLMVKIWLVAQAIMLPIYFLLSTNLKGMFGVSLMSFGAVFVVTAFLAIPALLRRRVWHWGPNTLAEINEKRERRDAGFDAFTNKLTRVFVPLFKAVLWAVAALLAFFGGRPLYTQVRLYLETGHWVELPATGMFLPLNTSLSSGLLLFPWDWLEKPSSWLGLREIVFSLLSTLNYSVIPVSIALILVIFLNQGE